MSTLLKNPFLSYFFCFFLTQLQTQNFNAAKEPLLLFHSNIQSWQMRSLPTLDPYVLFLLSFLRIKWSTVHFECIFTLLPAPNAIPWDVDELDLLGLFHAPFGNTTRNHGCNSFWLEIRVLHLHWTRFCYDVDRNGYNLFISHAFYPKMYHCLATHLLLYTWLAVDSNPILNHLDYGCHYFLPSTLGLEWNPTRTIRIEVKKLFLTASNFLVISMLWN